MALDISLVKPDATKTITLKVEDIVMVGKSEKQTMTSLPGKSTIAIDLGYRKRTFLLRGKLTSRTDREDLEDAWLNWWNNGDGQSKLIWGKKNDNSDYDFKVYITDLQIAWSSKRPGTASVPVYDFTLGLQEVGTIGALN